MTRGLTAEGRPDELGLPTFPARDFVTAGGLTIAHLGVHEHELVDLESAGDGQAARTLAMTLLRSTGMLSRVGMTYRPVPAGPLTPVDGLQLVGRSIETSYLIALGDRGPVGPGGGRSPCRSNRSPRSVAAPAPSAAARSRWRGRS